MDTRIRRAAFGLLLLLLGSMTACKQTETIKVLQFNIWQEGTVVKGGFEAVADEIARTDADFVTLSEVRNYHDTRFCDRIVAALKERGKTYYSFYTEDSGLLSRYPLTDSSTVFPLNDDRGSLYRLVKAYRNVRVYRSDAQMVCDSMVSFSTDSIIHLYINPLLWNNSNQIASDVVDIYTANRQITRAEFLGQPIMVAEIDTTYYNQVAGKQMTAFFRDNEIYRNDVDGNVQTIYFQREDETSPVVTEMIYLESASASFYIEDKELVGMTYRNDVPFTLYPIAQVPPTQPLRLKNFKWEPWRRPTRAAIFNETIRPSRREEAQSRERPRFSIVERMDRYKERLLRSGEWVDREDELKPEVVEWRDTRER